jgi:hypothetical protein
MSKTVIATPSRLQVEQALWDLDGKSRNDLYLQTSDELTYMGICGGAGRYQVSIAEHHERFAHLLSTQDLSKEEDLIMCGGQLSAFPRRYLVDFQTALTAAVHYLGTAQPAQELSWEWDG